MKSHIKFLIRVTAFSLILFMCINTVNHILVPKFFVDDDWPYSATDVGFYEIEKNTVDVLFLGSSHAATFYIPQELYNNYGITSYNLSSGQQDMLTTYYWIKEALRSQHPRAIIIETCMLFPYDTTQPLNVPEANTRKAFDYMKWSEVKVNAINDICRIDENQSLLSYYLPNIRYHQRWKSLNNDDFSSERILREKHFEMKGYIALADRYTVKGEPFEVDATVEAAEPAPVMKEYMDKIVELCKEEGIALILTTNPTTTPSVQKYNMLSAYAASNNIWYIDFNEKNTYQAAVYNYETDNADYVHGNIDGAIKITNYMGLLLREQWDIEDGESEEWEQTRGWYEWVKRDSHLRYVTDINEYLSDIKDERYTVFVATKGEINDTLNENVAMKIYDLGVKSDLLGEFQNSYVAVIGDKIVENMSSDSASNAGLLNRGRISYEVCSTGDTCTIKINGVEYAKQCEGLNLVIYNNITERVIDSVIIGNDEESVIR